MQVEDNFNIANLKPKQNEREENILPLRLYNSINNIIKKEGYISYIVEKKFVSTEGGNYLGVLYEVDIEGKTKDGKKETNLFIKNIIPGENMKILSVTGAYTKEKYAYKDLSKVFKELQDEAAVPDHERFVMVKSFDDNNPEAIILENLTKRGFKTFNRMDVVSLHFAELAITQLAKLHGLSYALQRKNPSYFERNIKTLQEPFLFNEEWKVFIENMIKVSTKCLHGAETVKMNAFTSSFLSKMPLYMRDTQSINACLCHGDYRSNNILMKNINGEITKVIPIDYQLMYYGCPILDFLYFIFVATDRQFRKDHLEYLKDVYYESLETFLKYFNISMDSVFTRKEFEKAYKEKLDYGLMITVMITPFLFVAEDNVPDLGSQSLSDLDINTNSGFDERIRGAVNDFIEWGYL